VIDNIDRYRSLVDGYEEGIYTGREVVGQALDMLAKGENREGLWQALSTEHREAIAQFLADYDETAPPLFPVEHWRKVKDELVDLKEWYRAR
jgi:hypothetical protein